VAQRVRLPVLVSDGASDSSVAIENNQIAVTQHGGTLTYQVEQPKDGASTMRLIDPTTVSHNGRVRPAVAGLPASDDAPAAKWHATLTSARP